MNRKGFTLLELLVVITILSIIIIFLIPNTFAMLEKGNKENCQSLIDSIESSAKMYVMNNKYKLGFECNSPKNIKFKTLVNSGDLALGESNQLINPLTNEEISLENTVEVIFDCDTKEFSYQVNGINCTE